MDRNNHTGDDGDRRSHDIEIFSSPSDAPRTRWRTDLVSAATWASLLVVLAIVAGDGSTFDDNALAFIGSFPGWLLWLAQAAYFVGVLYVVILAVGVGIVARGRLELLRDIVLAAAVAIALVLILSRILDGGWPEVALLDLQKTRDTFPTFSIAAGIAIQSAVAPHVTVPVRHLGAAIMSAATVAAVLGVVTTVSDALGGVLVGLLAAALVRYAFGTTAGIPSTNRIKRGLSDLGVELDDLRYDGDQAGVALALTGTSVDGAPRYVSVLGSDSWNSRVLARWWRQAWYHDVGSQYGSDRRQQVEHEALAMVLAARDGASVPALIAVGSTQDDDAVVVTTSRARTLGDVAPDEIDDAMLESIWGAVTRLHRAGLSHGSIDPLHVWFDADGSVRLAGFADAALNASTAQQRTDVAATLVTTALHTSGDRAVAAARTALGDAELAATLPLLQSASLSTDLRSAARRCKVKAGDLRKQAASTLGIDAPEPEQLTRVSWMNLLMVALVGFVAYTLIASLADIGLDTLVDTLSGAHWGLVVLALLVGQATNVTDAYALVKVSPKPVPVGITTVEQFAIGFVNIAVPSAAGRVATNARYFQKFGIPPVTSTACGAITGFLGFLAQIVLIIVTILVGDGSIDLSQLQTGGTVLRLTVLALIIAAAALVVVAVVPKLRHWVIDHIRNPLSQLREALATVRNPRIAIKALAGALGSEILYGAGLAMCVLAMGGSINLGEAIFINVTVSLFAGLMPIPGGVGVAEAGLTAGLTAIGVPSDVAVGAVLIWRLVSYYLPPVWGYISLRWLSRHEYL